GHHRPGGAKQIGELLVEAQHRFLALGDIHAQRLRCRDDRAHATARQVVVGDVVLFEELERPDVGEATRTADTDRHPDPQAANAVTSSSAYGVESWAVVISR